MFRKILITFFAIIAFFGSSKSQVNEQFKPVTTRILFLLDASLSMAAQWEDQKRMDVAKEILAHIVDSLSSFDNLELALRVYGHQTAKGKFNCRDTKLEVAFAPKNGEIIKTKLKSIQPKGVTPLAFSLSRAANDFIAPNNYRNVIIIITDGLESCDGDPCEISILGLFPRGSTMQHLFHLFFLWKTLKLESIILISI